MVQKRKKHSKNSHLIIRNQSKQCGAMSDASEQANGWASGPVLTFGFLAVLDHSVLTDITSLEWQHSYPRPSHRFSDVTPPGMSIAWGKGSAVASLSFGWLVRLSVYKWFSNLSIRPSITLSVSYHLVCLTKAVSLDSWIFRFVPSSQTRSRKLLAQFGLVYFISDVLSNSCCVPFGNGAKWLIQGRVVRVFLFLQELGHFQIKLSKWF